MNDIQSGKHDLQSINPHVRAAAGLDVHEKENQPPKQRVREKRKRSTKQCFRTEPCLEVADLTPTEVHRWTGFCDLKTLLSFVAVICDGNLETMMQQTTVMTWLEEWIFVEEFAYGRTRIRWQDFESDWKKNDKSLWRVLHDKMKLILQARRNWPMYATVEEDLDLRDASWEQYFPKSDKHRVVMHDNTDVPLMDASDPDLHRALYSEYYGKCCGKGGTVLQQCGFIQTIPLCTGAINDGGYCDETKIFQKQKQFTEQDTSSPEPALNVLDKGYRSTLAAKEHGQQCFQPDFAESDCKFGEKRLYIQLVLLLFGWAMNEL